jgi:signal transduction histidine kinase
MAHEIYNPLAGILALVEILLTEKNLKETTKSDLLEIQKAAIRAQKVIENLQDFVSQETEVTAITLDEIIEKTLPLLKMKWRSYRLNLDLKANGSQVHVQPQLISQVIYNLIQNACQAMPHGKTLHLRTYEQNKSVIMEVTDEGSGISDSNKASIFKPFFTTKPTGEGTGLGLSLSKQFVERFGGQLTFHTTDGKGTTFKMELPI